MQFVVVAFVAANLVGGHAPLRCTRYRAVFLGRVATTSSSQLRLALPSPSDVESVIGFGLRAT